MWAQKNCSIIKDIGVNKQLNKHGLTALIMATQEGHQEMVQLLLDYKDINVNEQDFYGQTALFEASCHGQKEIQLLLKHKDIDVNQQNILGTTALYGASVRGHTKILQLLLKHEDINFNKKDLYSALSVASEKGHKEVLGCTISNVVFFQILFDHKN
jgi:ankyrin repeat domain-containing protein 50